MERWGGWWVSPWETDRLFPTIQGRNDKEGARRRRKQIPGVTVLVGLLPH